MSIRFYKFLIVFMGLFFAQKVSGQVSGPGTQFKRSLFTQSYADSSQQIKWLASYESSSPAAGLRLIGQDHYVKHLAFFCRQEWKIERSLKIPLRLRVGSLEQCNTLEGK